MFHFLLEEIRITEDCFALWVRVLMTLYLAERWWWLSYCRYWSMFMGFWYTVMDNLPSFSGVTMVSRKGIAQSSLLFSTVNCMARSTLSWRTICLYSSFWMTKVSSTYQHQSLGGRQCLELLLKVLHMKISYNWPYWGTHSHTLNLFIELVLEGKASNLEEKF